MHLVGSFNVFPNFDFDQSPLLIYLEASNLPFVIDEWFAAILTLFLKAMCTCRRENGYSYIAYGVLLIIMSLYQNF